MRNFVKNQGCYMFGSGWTQKKVWGFSDIQLTNKYDMIIFNLHSSGINVPDVLEKRGRLLGPSVAKRIRLDDSTDKTQETTESFFSPQENIHSPSVVTQEDASHADVPSSPANVVADDDVEPTDDVHIDGLVDMSKASEPVPSEEHFANSHHDISFPSPPSNRKKTLG